MAFASLPLFFFAVVSLPEIVQSPLIYTSVSEKYNHAHGHAKM